MAKENDEKFERKANLDYVKEKDRAAHHRMDGIDSNYKELSGKIDINHNFMVKAFTDLSTNVMKALSKK